MQQGDPKSLLAALFDFSFRHFITGKIIRFLYALSVLMAALVYLMMVIGGFNVSSGIGAFTLLILGPLAFLVWVIYARVTLEIIMVVFRISEDLSGLRGWATQAPAAPPMPPAEPE